MHTKLKFTAILLLFALSVSWWLHFNSAQADTTPRDALAAVNGVFISKQDLQKEIKYIQIEMTLRNWPLTSRQVNMLRTQLIENLIERELLYQQAKKKIKAHKRWINIAFNDLKAQLGGKTSFQRQLRQTGVNKTQLRERIRKGLMIRQHLRKTIIQPIKVSRAEIQAFYRRHPNLFKGEERLHLRHILIQKNKVNVKNVQTNDELNINALLKIQMLQNRLQQGANFAVLALDYSDCPSKSLGGDLGFLSRRQMIESFAQAAFALKPGTISDIVETRLGYHLIQMVARKAPSRLAFKEVHHKIERTLRRNKEKTAVAAYLSKLKNQATITRFGKRK